MYSLGPAPEYSFGVVVSPIGTYYKGGLQGADAGVVKNYDRAAPMGVGNVKVRCGCFVFEQSSEKKEKCKVIVVLCI